jgi:hypothetical protein
MNLYQNINTDTKMLVTVEKVEQKSDGSLTDVTSQINSVKTPIIDNGNC